MSVSPCRLLWGLVGCRYSFDSFYIKGPAVCWDAGEVRIYDLGISFNLERYNIGPWLRQFKDPAEVSRHPSNSESYAVFYGVWRMLILPLLRGLPRKCTTSIGHRLNSQLWCYAVWGRVNQHWSPHLWSLLLNWLVMSFSLPCDSDQWWYIWTWGGVRENEELGVGNAEYNITEDWGLGINFMKPECLCQFKKSCSSHFDYC